MEVILLTAFSSVVTTDTTKQNRNSASVSAATMVLVGLTA